MMEKTQVVKRWMWLTGLCLLALSVMVYPNQAQSAKTVATIVYVDAINGSNTTGNGTAAQPWRTITFAMPQVSAGDTIQIQPGTYNADLGEVFPIRITPGVSLIGSGEALSVISGVTTTTLVFLDASTTDILSDTVLSDFTIQNGNIGLQMYANEYRTLSPSIARLLIRNNTVGIHMDTSIANGYGATIMGTISDTQVLSNSQQGLYMQADSLLSLSVVAPTIVNSSFQGNGGHGLQIHALAFATASPRLVGVHIQDNLGDGVLAQGSYNGLAQPQIENSWIENNTGFGWRWEAYSNGGDVNAFITNTVIAHNQAGGLYLEEREGGNVGQVWLVNSTLLENKNYGIFWERLYFPVTVQVLNSILWNPNADDLYSNGTPWSEAEVQYSIIEDGDFAGQQGNLGQDPILIGDHLSACSPARDAGTSTGAPATDIDGEPRLGLPDIGADEYDAICVLQSGQVVSTANAGWGEVLTYTLTLTNSTVLTPVTVLLTDTLPNALTYIPGTLTATQGATANIGNVITWSGTLTPGETVTISLQSQVTTAGQTIHNFAVADVAGMGLHRSPIATTVARPVQTYLPTVFQQYCGGPSIDTFDNPGSGWPILTNAYWTYGYSGGEYQFLAHQGGAFGAVSRGERPTRFVLEADVRQATTATGSFGLLFQLNDNWSEFFTFEIYPPTQDFAVFQYLNGNWSVYHTGHRPDAVLPGQNVNRLRIEFGSSGGADYYRLYVNGIQVSSIYWLVGLPARRVGLTATSDVAGLDARFDNYKLVWEGCPENLQADLASPTLLEAALEFDRPWPWADTP